MQIKATNAGIHQHSHQAHVPVAAVLVLSTPDDGRLRPKHVE